MISCAQPQLSLPRRQDDGCAGFVLSSSPAAGFQHVLFSNSVYLRGLLSSPPCRRAALRCGAVRGALAAQPPPRPTATPGGAPCSLLLMKIASFADGDKRRQTNTTRPIELVFLLRT